MTICKLVLLGNIRPPNELRVDFVNILRQLDYRVVDCLTWTFVGRPMWNSRDHSITCFPQAASHRSHDMLTTTTKKLPAEHDLKSFRIKYEASARWRPTPRL